MTYSLQTSSTSIRLLFIIAFFWFISSFTTTNAHNITQILSAYPSLSTFNHYLTVTRLDTEINNRKNVTILVVENSAMSLILSKQLPVQTIRSVLSLHILVNYFGAKRLHGLPGGSTVTASLYQASGSAPGTSGFINITNLKGGKVGFGTDDGNLIAFFVKTVHESPSNISVQQISQLLQSNQAEAPTSTPNINLAATLGKECKSFTDLLIDTKTEAIFNDYVNGGLTVFCPINIAVESFMPKYNNLTAVNKEALLLFHGLPLFQTILMLKSNNGMVTTLASSGSNKFLIKVQNVKEVITLETKVATSNVTGTIVVQDPLAVYMIDKFLQPEEFFDTVVSTAPAPDSADAPAPSEGEPSDDESRGFRCRVEGLLMVIFSFCVCCLLG